jgi:hypothetical protein
MKHSFWLSEELGHCTVNNDYKEGVFEPKFVNTTVEYQYSIYSTCSAEVFSTLLQ